MFGRLQVTQNVNVKSLQARKKTDMELLEDLEYEMEKKRRHHDELEEASEKHNDQFNQLSFRQYDLLPEMIVRIIRDIVYGKYEEYFYFFIMSACFLSGITAGIQTYQTSGIVHEMIGAINSVVLAIFIMEICLKMCAAGSKPWNYFIDPLHGRWNTFDFLVTVASVPGVAGKATALVRILRLFRIIEQFQKISAMKAIVMGLLAGMKSIGYILLLLLLVFYIYAVVAVSSFQENNAFCFGTVGQALISLFRGMTLENWEVMMFIDSFGCDRYDGGIYYQPWENISINETKTLDNKWTDVWHKFRCGHPKQQSYLAPFFWVSFVVVASFVVLALFIGVITLHMQDSINIVRLEKEEMLRKKRLTQQLEDLKNIRVANTVLNLINKVNDSRAEKRKAARKAAKKTASPVQEAMESSPVVQPRRRSLFHSVSNSMPFSASGEDFVHYVRRLAFSLGSNSSNANPQPVSPFPPAGVAPIDSTVGANVQDVLSQIISESRKRTSSHDSAKNPSIAESIANGQPGKLHVEGFSRNSSGRSSFKKPTEDEVGNRSRSGSDRAEDGAAFGRSLSGEGMNGSGKGHDGMRSRRESFKSQMSLNKLLEETARANGVAMNPYLLTMRRDVGKAAHDPNGRLPREPSNNNVALVTSQSTGHVLSKAAVEDSDDDEDEQGAQSGVGTEGEDNYKIKVTSSSKIRRINEMTSLLVQAWHGESYAQQHNDELLKAASPFVRRIRPWKVMAVKFLESSFFHFFVTSLILFSSILIGLELDMATPENVKVFLKLENLVIVLFCIELFVRFVAEELDLITFFSTGWNVFDLGVIIASALPGSSSIILLFRLFRIFRLMKLLRMLPQLQTIVQALFSGLASIRYVGTIIAFVFYVYALLGYMIFHENDPGNFGTLDAGLVTLFAVITLDNWGVIMYTNMYGCDNFPTISPCENSKSVGLLSALYFISFIIFGSFVLLTLFIGVVTTAMEAAAGEKEKILRIERKCDELVTNKTLDQVTLDLYKRVFSILDTDGSGTIEVSEIQMGLNCVKMQPTTHELCGWIEAAGLDPNLGSYGMYDFIVFMIAMKKRNARERFKEAIRKTYKRNNRNKTFVDAEPEVKPKPVNKLRNIISMFGIMPRKTQIAVATEDHDDNQSTAANDQPQVDDNTSIGVGALMPALRVLGAFGGRSGKPGFAVAGQPSNKIERDIPIVGQPASASVADSNANVSDAKENLLTSMPARTSDAAINKAVLGFKIKSKPGHVKASELAPVIAPPSKHAAATDNVHTANEILSVMACGDDQSIPPASVVAQFGVDSSSGSLKPSFSRDSSDAKNEMNFSNWVSGSALRSNEQALLARVGGTDKKKPSPDFKKQTTYDSECNSLEFSQHGSLDNGNGESISPEISSKLISLPSFDVQPFDSAAGASTMHSPSCGDPEPDMASGRGAFFSTRMDGRPAESGMSTKSQVQSLVRSIVAL